MLKRIALTWAINAANSIVFLLSWGTKVLHEGYFRRGRWIDWYRVFPSRPKHYEEPESEEQLREIVQRATGVRVVGLSLGRRLRPSALFPPRRNRVRRTFRELSGLPERSPAVAQPAKVPVDHRGAFHPRPLPCAAGSGGGQADGLHRAGPQHDSKNRSDLQGIRTDRPAPRGAAPFGQEALHRPPQDGRDLRNGKDGPLPHGKNKTRKASSTIPSHATCPLDSRVSRVRESTTTRLRSTEGPPPFPAAPSQSGLAGGRSVLDPPQSSGLG